MMSPPLNIANVLASRGKGGLETHYVQLCNHLARSMNITAIAHPEFGSELDPAVRHLPLNLSRSRRHPVTLWQLAKALRRERFDIIHGHANKAVNMLGTLRPFLRAPLVGTLHNQKQDTRVFRRMDHAIAVSRAAADRISHVPVDVIYNGLPHREPTPIDLREIFSLPRDRPVVLAVGRLVSAKGFDLLMEAAAPLKVSLLIAGDGEEANKLRKQLASRRPTAQIRLIGYRSDVTNLIGASDGVVISSRREGFSYVVAETLLLGRPLLATDVPVANEILPRELIVPVENATALRERLAALLEKPEHWHELTGSASAFAREHFTIDTMVRRTAALYRRVADGKST